MIQKVVTARLPNNVYSALSGKAKAEGRSLSATIALVLSESLELACEHGEATATGEKPAWAIALEALEALEARVSNLEAQQQGGGTRNGRKGKRRR